MSKHNRSVLAGIMGVAMLTLASGAFAHDRGRHGGHPGHGWGHYQHHHHHDHHRYRVVRERVVFHPPPPVIYAQRAYYGPPAIVIGVDLPPLLVRLR